MESDLANCLAKFESLGDNCEFGFLQRFANVDPGGLFRWAVTPPHSLIRFLENRGEGVYAFETLEPSRDDMVLDKRYNIAFHTQMFSREVDGTRSYIAVGEELRETYLNESKKIQYLKEKLFGIALNASSIFVYKQNSGIDLEVASRVAAELRVYNSRNQLLVVNVASSPQEVGVVRRHGENLLLGYIDRFAPYSQANEISAEVWSMIVNRARSMAET